jgi:hypothetical protein
MVGRSKGWKWIGALIVALVLAEGWWHHAGAIPAFARKFDVPCGQCHTIPPALNDAGEAFRAQGYRLIESSESGSDNAPVAAEEPTAVAKDLPEGVERAYWPLSARTMFGYSYRSRDSQDTDLGEAKVQTRGSGTERLDLLLGGSLTQDMNFYVRFEPAVDNVDLGTPEGQNGELESAWIRLNDLRIQDVKVNLKVGTFELDVPVSRYRRHTLTTYPIYAYFPSGSAAADDPDTTLDWSRAQRGGEVSGRAPWSLSYSLALVNGTNGSGDSNNAFDYYLRVAGPVEDHRVGGFLYWGTAPTNFQFTPTGDPIAGTGQSNENFYRLGVDGDIRSAPVRVLAMAEYGIDSKGLFGGSDPQDASFGGGFLEVQYDLLADWSLLWALRYDVIRNFDQGDATTDNKKGDLDGVTWAVRYDWVDTGSLAVILHGEYSHVKTKATSVDGNSQTDNRFTVAFDLML